MDRPWKNDPKVTVRDGVTYFTRSCPICFRKFRWAEECCYECLAKLAKDATDLDEESPDVH